MLPEIMGWGWASEGLDGHSPAPALGGKRKATSSRSSCIFLGRLLSQWLLVPPRARLLAPREEGRVGWGLEASQSHAPAGVIGCITHAAQEVCPPTASDLGEESVTQANTRSPKLLSQYWPQKWEPGHTEGGFGHFVIPEF